ncbi:hypothetical protein Fuma_01605 [Fuerstiella marisgermanici]|uniref:Uncharacterized protein n=1 Tax=Fuerstiella marisgermanici TaxID=1891926 RepID=A0A1P8WD83_9PLAN|nr:hypothetical protein Fuma_01605 [Fuerstiella marisgermanici]
MASRVWVSRGNLSPLFRLRRVFVVTASGATYVF